MYSTIPFDISQPTLWLHNSKLQLQTCWQSSPYVGNLQISEQLKLWDPKGHSVEIKKLISLTYIDKKKNGFESRNELKYTFTSRFLFAPEWTRTARSCSLKTIHKLVKFLISMIYIINYTIFYSWIKSKYLPHMLIDSFHVKQKIKIIPFILFSNFRYLTRNTFRKIFNDYTTLTSMLQGYFPKRCFSHRRIIYTHSYHVTLYDCNNFLLKLV